MAVCRSWLATAALILLLLEAVVCDSDFQTQKLFEAVDADNADGVRAAVAAGARINERGDKWSQGQQTPLMFASLTGKCKALKALLDLKADPRLGEKDGYTPLHGAAFQGRAEAAALLLADASVPNTFHDDGFAPIHRACWGSSKGHTDTVREFLKAGVAQDLRTKTSPSKRPVDFTNNPATLELLKSWTQKASGKASGDGAAAKVDAADEL
jgi:ankyrin repeat protein